MMKTAYDCDTLFAVEKLMRTAVVQKEPIMRKTLASSSNIAAFIVLVVAMLFLSLLVATAAPVPAYAFLGRGATFIVDGNTNKVTDIDDDREDPSEVELVKYGSSDKTPSIDAVRYQGERFKVESIGKNAFNNEAGHKITSVKLGRNVDRIKAKAFYDCKKLKTINLAKADVIDIDRSYYGYYLEETNIGSKAFKGAGTSKVKVKCGKSSADYQAIYKKALVKKGLRKSATVVK